MQQVIMLKGLPGSGKTTWARKYLEKYTWFRRVSKDDIRAMIGGEYSKPNEDTVCAIRDKIIGLLLDEGWSIIVDDTNINNKHFVKVQNICSYYNAELLWEIFETPLEECIERDAQRPNPVGETVIRRMDAQWHGPRVSLEEMRKAMGM